MFQTSIQTPQEVLQKYRSLLAMLVKGLKHGTHHARWYADTMDETPDRVLSPALVRKGAKRFLIAGGQTAHNEEDEEPPTDYEAQFVPNLGLAVSADGVHIKILRSDRSEMPIPGRSERRQAFYAQQQILPFDATEEIDGEAVAPAVVNLILHWSTDDDYNLDKVYLGCPKTGGLTRASVDAHWDELIWRRQHYEVTGGEQVEADVNELDIYLDSEKASGTHE